MSKDTKGLTYERMWQGVSSYLDGGAYIVARLDGAGYLTDVKKDDTGAKELFWSWESAQDRADELNRGESK